MDDEPKAGRVGADPAHEHWLGRQDEIGQLEHAGAVRDPRLQDRGVVRVALRPGERLLVQPERPRPVRDAQPELAEMLVAVDVWPEQPLQLPARRQGDEQGAVPEHGAREKGGTPAGRVGRAGRRRFHPGRGQFPQGATLRQLGTTSFTSCTPPAP